MGKERDNFSADALTNQKSVLSFKQILRMLIKQWNQARRWDDNNSAD